ncbi:phosphatidate cytidylyltransferase [Novosphingobium album (ex Liu et al. 2023)]|uniref:Phosphatidate cytidylyltransferase n=1 Tax=Novosphingobium album (ex Liu et al. 2023) TaxID=3031130 RepID=A0ABT5WPU8_9SPHN|nr:phosphatidate cytidylyltransferase [Novosphingobium album (ex Liu et al. 2023)]MDE8652073.1 phosphatidate cytidylyltransferase [Novosphingobium album (ex Liu et al. 2023)]
MSAPARKSDLGVRTVTALAMLAVSGIALWLGGLAWMLFVVAVAAGVFFEWGVLVLLAHPPGGARLAWRLGGAVYCAVAAVTLVVLRESAMGALPVLIVVGAVIGTDVGAYFAGRAIGGPKIAPAISPSKTWAGLVGGMVGAALVILLLVATRKDTDYTLWLVLAMGALIAMVAQAGDFFESWMKRRAGVKDSGKLLPGHGGLFDRVDGLLSVTFVLGVIFMISRLLGHS